ncbi:MAG: hypothetical protein ACLQVX_19595 [Limisphaerales bacterium]
MNIRAKYPLPHAGKVIAAGSTADLPENLARMLIARGQAEDAASAPAPALPPIAQQAAVPQKPSQPSPARLQG